MIMIMMLFAEPSFLFKKTWTDAISAELKTLFS